MKSETRTIHRTPKQKSELAAIRKEFSDWHPSLDELRQSGDYTEPIAMATKIQMMQAAAHLKALRESHRISLTELSKQCGVNKSALSRLENGVFDNATLLTMNKYTFALGEQVGFAFTKLAPSGTVYPVRTRRKRKSPSTTTVRGRRKPAKGKR